MWEVGGANEQAMIDADKNELGEQKEPTLAGLEPTRDKPNRFLVDRLNHSATVSSLLCKSRHWS